MSGGTITGNAANRGNNNAHGGGVYIAAGCTFNLNLPATTASIYGNTLQYVTGGEQVHNNGGTFNINGFPTGTSY
jgi:hypothetical protein